MIQNRAPTADKFHFDAPTNYLAGKEKFLKVDKILPLFPLHSRLKFYG